MTSPGSIPHDQTDGRCIAERGDHVQRKMLVERETPSARPCLCHGSLPCDRAPYGNGRRMVQSFCASVLGVPISLGAIQKVLDRVTQAIDPYYAVMAQQAR